MTNDIIQHALPGLMSPGEIKALVNSFTVMVDKEMLVSRLPDKGEREALQRRRGDLVTALRPCGMSITDKEKAQQALGLMFGGFTSLRKSDCEELVIAYLLHLDTLPLFAVIRACEAVPKCLLPNYDKAFPPTSPQLYSYAAKLVEHHRIELHQIENILTARKTIRPVDAPGAAERIAASLADFHARCPSIGTLTADERATITARQIEQNKSAILADYQRLGLEPVYAGGLLMTPTLARMQRIPLRRIGAER